MSELDDSKDPPVGRFLASFVVVPGAIVLMGLAIVVGIGWLTFEGADPDRLADTIEQREGNARWRAAVQLAGMLADPDHAAMRRDVQLAQRLTGILRRELEASGGRGQDVTWQVYLCRALGEFEVDVSLPVLVEATGTQHDGAVRRSAIEAIAVLADSLNRGQVAVVPGLVDSLLTASRDGDSKVRSSAAFTLGVLGGAQAEERLEALLGDGDTLVRYNAATGLARWGNAEAMESLIEMLQPNQSGRVAQVEEELVHVNALEALTQLLQANGEVPVERVRDAVEDLGEVTESPAVRRGIDKFERAFSAGEL